MKHNLINETIFKQCCKTCKLCDKEGNEIYHNCIECKPSFYFELFFDEFKNCYDNCSYCHYYDNINNTYFLHNHYNALIIIIN